MAHELSVNEEGKVEMAYTGEIPWHGLGTKVEENLTPGQFMKAANLDWNVEKQPLTYNTPTGAMIVDDREALIRSDSGKLLDIVGKKWNPVQNEQAFDFFNEVVETGDMSMHTAGALHGGSRVWAMATIRDEFELFGGDTVKGNLLFSNPHKYGETITIQFTPIRVVCQNTLNIALGGKDQLKVTWSHRKVFDKAVVQAMLGMSHVAMEQYKAKAEFLGSKRFKSEELQRFFGEVFPLGSKAKDEEEKIGRNAKLALGVMDSQPGAEFAEGSWWQAFNSATYFIDHMMGKNEASRMNTALFGYGVKYKQRALDTAMKMAEAS